MGAHCGKTEILGVSFDNLNIGQIVCRVYEKIDGFRKCGRVGKPFIIFTPNPEIVIEAEKDKNFRKCINSADIVAADGIGIVWASKFCGGKIKERASGYDIIQSIFAGCGAEAGISAFFLGGSEDSVTKAAVCMTKKYNGLHVCGTVNGYFKEPDNSEIINRINEKKPDLLLVGLGSPKQENWALKHAEFINAGVLIVVGGSFDVMSGNLKRAPAAFQKLGLEWLYRLIKQPSRIRRMARLPLFVVKVVIKYGKNKYLA